MQLQFLVLVLLPRLIANSDLPQLLMPNAFPSGSGNINGNSDFDQPTSSVYGATFLTVDKSDTVDTFVGVDGEITITGGPNSGQFYACPSGRIQKFHFGA